MSEFGCCGTKMRCHSGGYFDLVDPNPNDVHINDIAKALSNSCRFGGQIDAFYSVAEHLIHCSKIAENDGHPPDVVLAVLMHDASEAYVSDVIRPLKPLVNGFKELEKRVESAIAFRFGVDFDSHADVIHEIDNAVLIAEKRFLMPDDRELWSGQDEVRRLKIRFDLMRPLRSYTLFLAKFERLCGMVQDRNT